MRVSTRYTEVEQIIPSSWLIQGSIYDTKQDAQYAAASLFCVNRAVLVKPYKTRYALFYRK